MRGAQDCAVCQAGVFDRFRWARGAAFDRALPGGRVRRDGRAAVRAALQRQLPDRADARLCGLVDGAGAGSAHHPPECAATAAGDPALDGRFDRMVGRATRWWWRRSDFVPGDAFKPAAPLLVSENAQRDRAFHAHYRPAKSFTPTRWKIPDVSPGHGRAEMILSRNRRTACSNTPATRANLLHGRHAGWRAGEGKAQERKPRALGSRMAPDSQEVGPSEIFQRRSDFHALFTRTFVVHRSQHGLGIGGVCRATGQHGRCGDEDGERPL